MTNDRCGMPTVTLALLGGVVVGLVPFARLAIHAWRYLTNQARF